MTKDKKIKLPIADIIIKERQRKDLGDIAGLAESLKAHGQLQAIGVNERNELIWGRRRLAAATLLQWEGVDVIKKVGLTPLDEQLIEWEEDYRQKPRDWKEKCTALRKLFLLMKQKWALEKGEKWTQQMMVDFTGIGTATSVYYMLAVAEELEREPQGEISKTNSLREALVIFAERRRKEAVGEMERRNEAKRVASVALQHKEAIEFSELDIEAMGDPTLYEEVAAPLASTVEENVVKLYGFLAAQYDLAKLPKMKMAILNRREEDDCKLIAAHLIQGGAVISWMSHLEFYGKQQANWPLIWHTPNSIYGSTAFGLDYKMGLVWFNGCETGVVPASSVIIASSQEDKMLPMAVVHHLVNALTQEGDFILCLGYVNPADVAATGRIPVFIEELETQFNWKMEELKRYYELNIRELSLYETL